VQGDEEDEDEEDDEEMDDQGRLIPRMRAGDEGEFGKSCMDEDGTRGMLQAGGGSDSFSGVLHEGGG
jgi:hypothetical protein